VIFGSDAGGRSFASQLGKVLGADIPEDARRLILDHFSWKKTAEKLISVIDEVGDRH
jgi:hypothetical protein